jgi:hypothetical protein
MVRAPSLGPLVDMRYETESEVSLDEFGIETTDQALEVFALAISLVAMGLEDALHEQPDNPVLVPLAADLVTAYVQKSFGTTDAIAEHMADALLSTVMKELDL